MAGLTQRCYLTRTPLRRPSPRTPPPCWPCKVAAPPTPPAGCCSTPTAPPESSLRTAVALGVLESRRARVLTARRHDASSSPRHPPLHRRHPPPLACTTVLPKPANITRTTTTTTTRPAHRRDVSEVVGNAVLPGCRLPPHLRRGGPSLG